ncbi:MAG: hypothetical protein HY276_13400 [Ignavibacteriales bacterium]|nr:hypothetical protein [Ignavibacteriales bacterium]
MKSLFIFILVFCDLISANHAQCQDVFEAGNKIDVRIFPTIAATSNGYSYHYTISNGDTAHQEIDEFSISPLGRVSIIQLTSGSDWEVVLFNEEEMLVRWLAKPKEEEVGYINAIKPRSSRGGFSFVSNGLPSIVIYYAEGDHPLPIGEVDSIPGYTDLTPFGPGVVGKTVGPAIVTIPFVPLSFLDTLISYKRQSNVLGWLGSKKEDEKNEEKDDGELKELDKRLEETRKALVKGDSSKAQKELVEFVEKVEEIRKESEKAEENKKEHEVVMTSEAYALLKFNAEYLIDRLPKKKK